MCHIRPTALGDYGLDLNREKCARGEQMVLIDASTLGRLTLPLFRTHPHYTALTVLYPTLTVLCVPDPTLTVLYVSYSLSSGWELWFVPQS